MASQRDILFEKIKNLQHKIEHEPDVGRRLVLQERLNDAVKAMNEYMTQKEQGRTQ